MASIGKILPQPRVLPLTGLVSQGKGLEFREQVLLALDTLRQNPLRSSLTILGIVIMNIMLVSVTERTREIGLRKAVGARRSDILLQFLIESSTIAVIGGALGVILGVLSAKLVSQLSPLPSAVQLWSVIGGLLVALSVGLFFGTYPASKAAKLDPVEALRSE